LSSMNLSKQPTKYCTNYKQNQHHQDASKTAFGLSFGGDVGL
jgi:hypothetical protein